MSVWEVIGDHLVSKNYDRDLFLHLLKFIDALENAIEVPRVLDSFIRTIPHLHRLTGLYTGLDSDLPLSDWEEICREILTDRTMQELLSTTNKKGKIPLKGKYKDNPVYVALWQRPEELSDQQIYFHLLAHELIAVAILRNRVGQQKHIEVQDRELDDFKEKIYRALLSLRNLALPENITTLRSLPDLNVTPDVLLKHIEHSGEILNPVRIVLIYLLKIRKPPHRHEHDKQHLPDSDIETDPRYDLPAIVTEIQTNLDLEQENGTASFDVIKLPVVRKSKSHEIEEAGCSPNEDHSGAEIVAQRMTELNCREVTSSGQKGIQKHNIRKHLSMMNQRMTSRWEVLSLYEISVFLTAVEDLIKHEENSVYLPKKASYLELAALLTAMFWCGQRLDTAVKLTLYHHCSKDRPHPGFVKMPGLSGYWWKRPAVPDRQKLPIGLQQMQAHPAVHHFALSSGIGIEQIISRYVMFSHSGRTKRLFPRKHEEYERMVADFLLLVKRRNATRLTANRISDYLFEVISHQEGADLTSAMFITGHTHFLGVNPSFYTSVSVTGLQALYTRVCREIRDRHACEKPHENHSRHDEDSIAELQETDQGLHVGSPFRPTQPTVKSLIEELQRSLIHASGEKVTSIMKLLRLHNSMTRYTAFLITFSTGFRAIRDPFMSAAEIDWKSGFAVLSDKDNEDNYNSRLVWLPPVCMQQLLHFREHQQNALYRLSILIPDIFSTLGHARRNAPESHMFFAKEDKDRTGHMAELLSPKRMETILGNKYNLPYNASRHYLRSRLLEKECPIEVINAFMGHYERGEEPWGRYSGLSPLQYRKELIDNLVPILDKDGWKALPGLSAQL